MFPSTMLAYLRGGSASAVVRALRDICTSDLVFYSRLCPSTAGSSPPPVSSNFLCPLLSLSIPLLVAPQCHLSDDVLVFRSFDLTPFMCHSVLLIVHLLSFSLAMCPAHFNFVLVTYWTMSVVLVLCLMMVLRVQYTDTTQTTPNAEQF